MNSIISQAISDNNARLASMIIDDTSERVIKEMNYLFRTLDEDEDVRIKQLEAAISAASLAKLEAAASSTSPISSGMPNGKGSVTDRTAIAVEIAMLKSLIFEKICREEQELRRLMNYISGVEDSLTRQILTARFVDNLSWQAVAMRVGGGNTAATVRQRCNRFLRQS